MLSVGRRGQGRGRCVRQKSAAGSEGLESSFGADEEGTGSNLVLEGSGWCGVEEGTGSMCGEAVEWTDGEPKGAEQPLLQLSRWTLEQRASNVGR